MLLQRPIPTPPRRPDSRRSSSRRSAARNRSRTCRSRSRRSPATQLGQLGVTTFDDVVKLLPNVTFSSNGPGQGNIYMRGLSVGFAGSQSSASINPFPNVATYLDEQSLTFPGRNLDVYMVDMERIEVLEGPQGTLFGGGAEAGVRPLHHEQAEAERHRGPRRRRLRHHRARRSEHQRERGAQPAAHRRTSSRCAACSTTTGAAATSTTCRRRSPAIRTSIAARAPTARRTPRKLATYNNYTLVASATRTRPRTRACASRRSTRSTTTGTS